MRRKQKQINDCYNNILEDFYLIITNYFFTVDNIYSNFKASFQQ